MSNMKEKVVLITGASSGIGRATAEAFAAKGANIVVAARRKEELDTLVASIVALGGKASAIKTDVSIAKNVEQMVAHTIEVFGSLDYAINCAGIEGKFGGVTDLLEEDWDQVIDINLGDRHLRMLAYWGHQLKLKSLFTVRQTLVRYFQKPPGSINDTTAVQLGQRIQ